MLKAFSICLLLSTIGLAASPVETAIRAAMDKEVADWNRGDLRGYVRSYGDNAVLAGNSIVRGSQDILKAYASSFATPEKMGKLSYSDLEVHPLDARFAYVIGHFHLARSQAGGGNMSGLFTLIFEKTRAGWKIVLDHTTADAH
jgi:ketosteroid isomerase-like protein